MEANIMVNSHMINSETERAFTLTQKTIYISEAGETMISTVKVYTYTLTGKYMMDWSKKVWCKVKESTTTWTVTPITMALFIKTKNTEKVYTTARKKFMKESGEMDREQVMHITIIKSIDKHTLAILSEERDMVEGDLFSRMVVFTLDNFKTIYLMVKETFSMLTKINTSGTLSKEKKKEKEYIISVKAQYSKVFGNQIQSNKAN